MSDITKNILKGCGLLLLIILVIVASSHFIAISADLDASGGCISVVFDKASVMNADKVVLRYSGIVITITDEDIVQEIASEFVVANRTDLCGYYEDFWLEIYNGEKLVRNVHWNECHDLATIYDADTLHWVFPSHEKIGQVELSQEFLDRLYEIIAAA